ncbi:hypothetical protein ACVWWK_001247 [Bradyrhizobium sp. LB9.1b]
MQQKLRKKPLDIERLKIGLRLKVDPRPAEDVARRRGLTEIRHREHHLLRPHHALGDALTLVDSAAAARIYRLMAVCHVAASLA